MAKSILRPPVIAGLVASVLILAAVAVLTYFTIPHPSHSGVTAFPGETDQAAANQPADPTVASLTPAGTDLIIGIGAGDHLVAISDLDEDRDGMTDLPRIGDFDHVDWEKLAKVGPKILITQFGDRMPAGLRERCNQMGIGLIDVRLDVLDDIYSEADVLGDALGEAATEHQAVADLKRRLTAVAQRAAGYRPVRAAIAISDGGSVGLIGPGSFHDQLLTIAGGVNVAANFKKPYIAMDREQLMALAPDVVLDLEPESGVTPQQMRQSARFWASLPDLPAVQMKRVCVITEPYCFGPGWHAADLAEVFAENLHPDMK